MNNFSQILEQAYAQFILNVAGKKIPITYRINIPSIEHPARQGKSSPEVILKQLYEDAKQQNFDLKKASVEEIRKFMIKNNLGLDCSGFVYRMLDYLAQKVKGKPLTKLGFNHVGITNSKILADDTHSIKVDPIDIKPGDVIKINGSGRIPHILIIIARQKNLITYAHSSKYTDPNGVHKSTFNISPDGNVHFIENLGVKTLNADEGNTLKRLRLFANE